MQKRRQRAIVQSGASYVSALKVIVTRWATVTARHPVWKGKRLCGDGSEPEILKWTPGCSYGEKYHTPFYAPIYNKEFCQPEWTLTVQV